jgi:HlyD family secretion protein
MMDRRRRAGIVFLVVAAGAALAWGFLRRSSDPRLDLVTAPTTRRDINATVTATGTIAPIVNVVVGTQVSGRIQTLSADYNDRVKKGQVLAQIEPSSFKARVDQAEAQVTKARATVTDADTTFRRIQQLVKDRIGSQSDLDAARTKLLEANADRKQAEANLSQARVDLANTRILSPIDGVVISRNVEEGQTVAASLQAPTLFTIADDLKKLQIIANVDEADVGQVAEGQEVVFTVDAFPQSTFRGAVRLIRNSPENVQGVVTYGSVIQVDNTDQRLRPGMTANVTILVARKKMALAVPNAALRFRPPESFRKKVSEAEEDSHGEAKKGKRLKSHVTIWRLKNGTPEPARIKIGITDGAYTEVKDGLEERDLVVVRTRSGETPAQKAPAAGGKSPVR